MLLTLVRWVLPGIICVAGLVILIVGQGDAAIEGAAMMGGAGLSVALISLLVRMGHEGERDRAREDAAREYFDEHGRWPDERCGRRP